MYNVVTIPVPTQEICTAGVECYVLDCQWGRRSRWLVGRELITPELYSRRVHIQSLPRSPSSQGTTAQNKDVRPALRAFHDNKRIPCTALAVQHTALAPGTSGSEGILVRSLCRFLELRKVLTGVQQTIGQLRSLGLAHSVFIMADTHSLKVPNWRRWAATVREVDKVDMPNMVQAVHARTGAMRSRTSTK